MMLLLKHFVLTSFPFLLSVSLLLPFGLLSCLDDVFLRLDGFGNWFDKFVLFVVFWFLALGV